MEIKITKDTYGHMKAVEDGLNLFEFEFRHDDDAWYFWMPGREYAPCVIPGKKFPMNYFLDACRARHFLIHDDGIDEKVHVDGIMHTVVK